MNGMDSRNGWLLMCSSSLQVSRLWLAHVRPPVCGHEDPHRPQRLGMFDIAQKPGGRFVGQLQKPTRAN